MEAIDLRWRKSSYSDNGGECIEVGHSAGRVMVRDTKDRQGPTLRFTPDAWRRFAKQLKSLASDTLATLSEIPRGGRFVCRKFVGAPSAEPYVLCPWLRLISSMSYASFMVSIFFFHSSSGSVTGIPRSLAISRSST